MRKILLCSLVAIIFSNCEISVRKSVAQDNIGIDRHFSYIEKIKDGMKYGIWYVDYNTSQTGYAVAVVNLTKDSLEVELLKKQLAKK